MNAFNILIASALISTATVSSASAAWSFADQEPATFASMYPDRDVLNGGALTPAGRMGARAPRWRGSSVWRGSGSQPPLAPVTSRTSKQLPGADDHRSRLERSTTARCGVPAAWMFLHPFVQGRK